jgi:integrase
MRICLNPCKFVQRIVIRAGQLPSGSVVAEKVAFMLKRKRQTNRLNDRQIRGFVTQGTAKFVADGNGLYLRVTGPGSASWFFRVKPGGKVIQKGIGSYPGKTLASARVTAEQMLQAVQEGRDPATVLKPKRAEAPQSFKVYAADFITGKKTEHRSLKAHAQWASTIERYCGDIAHKAPAEISYRDIELLLAQSDLAGKRETAQRVLQRVRNILDYAAKREGEPGRFNPALAVRLPKRKPGEVRHFAAAPYADVPGIVAALREKDCMSALVLRWSIATAARSSNARGALWADIDIDHGLWSIPGERMKGGVPFRQPLNAEALAVLELAKAKAGNSSRVFPGPNGGLISDVAINKLLAGIYPGITAHGFRSSFRQWGAEQTSFPAEALELCLAHVQTNRVVAAYQRSDLLEVRKLILAAWDNYCNGKSNVVELVQSQK